MPLIKLGCLVLRVFTANHAAFAGTGIQMDLVSI
jgi:hypothetical protein